MKKKLAELGKLLLLTGQLIFRALRIIGLLALLISLAQQLIQEISCKKNRT